MFIKRIEFADVPTDTGANGGDIVMAFKERYFEKYDIFKIDKTMQQCMVISRPVRRRDDYWEVTVRLIDNDYSSELDLSGCQVGDTTRFQSNAISWSSLYAAHEDVFVSIAEGKNQGCLNETIYKMNKKEKELLDNFLISRNQGLLFNKTNIDVNGKPTICDPETGRPINFQLFAA